MRTVLITGGTKGIGKATAIRLAKEDFNIILNYNSDDDAAREALQECNAIGSGISLIKADISDSSSVENMFASIMTRFGGIDVVINNAGININKPILEMSDEDWDRVVNVNMKGVFLVSRAAARIMSAQITESVIINIGSTTAIAGRVNGVNYCAAKAGVIVMTKCLARELGPRIRVNCVIPGLTRTEEIEERYHLKENEQYEIERRKIPLKRIGEPVDVANVIRFLISDEASYITGQKFIIDGGEYMY
jgi:3-oxoacyl-[acyl-carrier protein] reductase